MVKLSKRYRAAIQVSMYNITLTYEAKYWILFGIVGVALTDRSNYAKNDYTILSRYRSRLRQQSLKDQLTLLHY